MVDHGDVDIPMKIAGIKAMNTQEKIRRARPGEVSRNFFAVVGQPRNTDISGRSELCGRAAGRSFKAMSLDSRLVDDSDSPRARDVFIVECSQVDGGL